MRAASSLVFICFLLLSSKGSNFADKNSSSRKDGDAAPMSDDQEETIALEPTAVGGAYLGCFVDSQISPDLVSGQNADEMPVGCQVFEDSQFTRVKTNNSVIVESGELEFSGSRRPLVIRSLPQHPRWAWVTKVPLLALHANIFLQAQAKAGSAAVRVRVELLDFLPAGLVTSPEAFLSGSYKLRLKDTLFCADGNPVWGWDAAASKPIVDPIKINVCSNALNFRFTRFESGLRIHVPNPKPLTCDTQNYAVEHCSDSCIDLENFGLGNRFVLWACTKSVESQSYTLIPSTQGAIRIQGNGRPLTRFGGVLIPDLGTTVDFEILPVAP
jgi:hypothetical protein